MFPPFSDCQSCVERLSHASVTRRVIGILFPTPGRFSLIFFFQGLWEGGGVVKCLSVEKVNASTSAFGMLATPRLASKRIV